ncbi:hypothetical protein OKW27_001263 [Paraburkholderia sp. 35.1]
MDFKVGGPGDLVAGTDRSRVAWSTDALMRVGGAS